MNSQLPELIVGKIPFLVCLPYFYHHSNPKISLVEGSPSQLNPLLRSKKIHAAPLSSITYGRNPEQYLILPEICTSSHLEVHSVLLCSQVEIHQLHGKKIALSAQSATSNQLFELLCDRFLGIKAQLETEYTPECQARILIGDQALLARKSGEWTYIYELDSIWRDWKGLPFVFGIWTLDRNWVSGPGQEAMNEYFRLLKQNLARFPLEVERALENWNKQHPLPLDLPSCKAFLERMDYILDQERIQSLQIFYDECRLNGNLEQTVPLHFWEPQR